MHVSCLMSFFIYFFSLIEIEFNAQTVDSEDPESAGRGCYLRR